MQSECDNIMKGHVVMRSCMQQRKLSRYECVDDKDLRSAHTLTSADVKEVTCHIPPQCCHRLTTLIPPQCCHRLTTLIPPHLHLSTVLFYCVDISVFMSSSASLKHLENFVELVSGQLIQLVMLMLTGRHKKEWFISEFHFLRSPRHIYKEKYSSLGMDIR